MRPAAIARPDEAPTLVPARLSVSVVICAYTMARWVCIERAVASVWVQTLSPDEIILVADHAPQLAARARSTFTDVLVVENDQQRGLSGARNTGVIAATGDLVAFLDDDAMADPKWLELLSAGYDDPNVMGTGGAVTPIWPGHRRPQWFPAEFDWVIGCTYLGLPDRPSTVRNLVGANMSFRRTALLAAGQFACELGRVGSQPSGCEETELCIRLVRDRPGAVLRYDPSAVVHHLVTPDRCRWAYFRRRCWAEGLSKARVSTSVGPADGLSSERSYIRKTLPRAVCRALVQSCSSATVAGALQAAAIAAGFLATGSGYVYGRASMALASRVGIQRWRSRSAAP